MESGMEHVVVRSEGDPVGVLVEVEDREFLWREYPDGVVPVWALLDDGLRLSALRDPNDEGAYVFADADLAVRAGLDDEGFASQVADRVREHLDLFAEHEEKEDARVAGLTDGQRRIEIASLASGGSHLTSSEFADAIARLKR